MIKIFLFFFQNRQFVFAPKIQYKLTAERSEAGFSNLQFPQWCSILELVRTHFSEKIPPLARPKPIGEGGRKFGKAAELHRSKPQKNPSKNIGSNHILILGEENFLIMKRLAFIFSLMICLGVAITPVFADVLSGASCTVSAKIIDKGIETQKAYGSNGNFREYESKYLKLEILTTKPAGTFGDCGFIKIGNVFKIDGGSDPELLRIGDKITAGVESNSSMGPAGVVPFIQWQPISLIGDSRPLPAAFELQSGKDPEAISKNPSTETQITTDNGNSNPAEQQVATNTGNAKVSEENKNSNSIHPLILIFSVVGIFIIGGILYFLSRQRKT